MSGYLRYGAVLVTSLLVSATFGFAAGDNEKLREISEGVFSFTLGEGNFSMFVIGESGVAVFDTYDSRHSAAMLDAIETVTAKPIRYAFHSHNHWDHASGGQVFKDAGALTVMHTLAAEWLAANPGRDTVPPDVVWSGERKDIDMDGFTVEMRYLGMNHGRGMTVFTIPERSAAFVADLVNPNRVMFSVVPDFNIGEWERSLSEILDLDFDTAVCSHNELPADEALNGCTRTHVEEERQFIRDLRNAILAEFQKGTGFMQVPKAVRLPQYAHWAGYDE